MKTKTKTKMKAKTKTGTSTRTKTATKTRKMRKETVAKTGAETEEDGKHEKKTQRLEG